MQGLLCLTILLTIILEKKKVKNKRDIVKIQFRASIYVRVRLVTVNRSVGWLCLMLCSSYVAFLWTSRRGGILVTVQLRGLSMHSRDGKTI